MIWASIFIIIFYHSSSSWQLFAIYFGAGGSRRCNERNGYQIQQHFRKALNYQSDLTDAVHLGSLKILFHSFLTHFIALHLTDLSSSGELIFALQHSWVEKMRADVSSWSEHRRSESKNFIRGIERLRKIFFSGSIQWIKQTTSNDDN